MSLDCTSGLKMRIVFLRRTAKVGIATPTPHPPLSSILASLPPGRALNNRDNVLLVTEHWNNLGNKCVGNQLPPLHLCSKNLKKNSSMKMRLLPCEGQKTCNAFIFSIKFLITNASAILKYSPFCPSDPTEFAKNIFLVTTN